MLIGMALAATGTPQVEKYLGSDWILPYVVLTLGIVWIARDRVGQRLAAMPARTAWILGAATLIVVTLAFAVVYPLANSGRFGGGSDSDDALNLAANAILHGDNPYAVRTYLGAPATYLPGALLLAVPFAAMGNAAYQNLFWLAILFILAARTWRVQSALLLLWMVLVCPRTLQVVVTGGELLASGIYVALAVFVISERRHLEIRSLGSVVSAAALGIALSSRLNYLLIAPAVLVAVARRRGLAAMLLFGAIVTAAFCTVTLPFYFRDPAGFWTACVTEQNFAARQLTDVLPGGEVLLPALSGVAALAMAARATGRGRNLLGLCALVQAIPVAAIVVLSSIHDGAPSFIFAGYGMHSLFFLMLGLWPCLVQGRPSSEHTEDDVGD